MGNQTSEQLCLHEECHFQVPELRRQCSSYSEQEVEWERTMKVLFRYRQERSKCYGHWCNVDGEMSGPYEKRSLFYLWRNRTLSLRLQEADGEGKWFASEDERKGASAHIRALLAQMEEDDKEEFFADAEKQGFWLGDLDQHQFLLHWTFILQLLPWSIWINYLFQFKLRVQKKEVSKP